MSETKRPTTPALEEILGLAFPVLDYGFVRVVDYMGTDQCIESAARVSYGAGTRKVNQTRGLLRYLRRHRHTTPSEMVELKFHCCMPIFIARQWIRHRTVSVNEMSGRYSLLPMIFYSPPGEQFKSQSSSNNQGRGDKIEGQKYTAAIDMWNDLRKKNVQLYTDLTADNVARELARIDLPLSTYTQWYWKIDLHNLLHFLTLRVDPHAQWEIQEYGKGMAGMLKRAAPLSYEAWIDYDVCGQRFSRMDLDVLRELVGVSVNQDFLFPHGKTIQTDALPERFNLNKREVQELLNKLSPREVPDFELDLAKAKPAEYFEKLMNEAVPNVDKKNSVP